MDAFSAKNSDPAGAGSRDRVLVALGEDLGIARVCGRGSYKLSASVKHFAERILNLGFRNLILDMRDCEGMDSTFMGVLAGISQRLKTESGGRLILTRVSPKLRYLMKTLGLDRLVEIREDAPAAAPAPTEELKVAQDSPEETARRVLEAHETLAEIDEENRVRFQDVLEFLRQDVNLKRP